MTSEASNIAGNVASGAETAVSQASNAAQTAAINASGKLQSLVNDIKTQLPESYSIGIWGDCQEKNGRDTRCTAPSTSFSFDLENILGSVSEDVTSTIPGFTKLHAASQTLSRWSISAYIIGFVFTVAAVAFGTVNLAFSWGIMVTVISSTVS